MILKKLKNEKKQQKRDMLVQKESQPCRPLKDELKIINQVNTMLCGDKILR